MTELAVIEGGLHDPYLPIPDGVRMNGVWLALDGMVNLDDLCGPYRPGKIVRIRCQDALRYIPPSMDDYERIAGLISDAA